MGVVIDGFVLEALSDVAEDAQASQPVWAASVLAAFAAVAAHVAVHRASSRATRFTLAALILLTAGVIGAAAVQVVRARAETLQLATAPLGSGLPAFRAELNWLALTGLLTAVLVPCAGSAVIRASRRRSSRLLATGLTLVLTVVGVSALMYVELFHDAWSSAYRGILGTRAERLAGLTDLNLWIDRASWLVVALGALSCAVAIRARLQEGRHLHSNRWSTLVAACVLAVGLSAFLATRPHAYDRRWPVLSPDPVSGPGEPTATLEGLPTSCDPQGLGPWLSVSDHIRLDGRLLHPAEAAEHFATVRRNWAVLHPNETDPGELLLSAAPSAPLTELMPYLQRARANGYSTLVIQTFRPVTVETRTLGVLSRHRRCPIRVELAPGVSRPPVTVEALVREVIGGVRTTLPVGT